MVFDEEAEKWAPRFGYKKAGNTTNQKDAVVEWKNGDDPKIDPFEKDREKTKAAQAKQDLQEQRNYQVASASTQMRRVGGVANVAKAEAAFHLSRKATASMGKFDKQITDAPKQGQVKNKKFDPVTKAKGDKSNAEKTKMMNSVLGDGSEVAREIKKAGAGGVKGAPKMSKSQLKKTPSKKTENGGKGPSGGKAGGVKKKGKNN